MENEMEWDFDYQTTMVDGYTIETMYDESTKKWESFPFGHEPSGLRVVADTPEDAEAELLAILQSIENIQ